MRVQLLGAPGRLGVSTGKEGKLKAYAPQLLEDLFSYFIKKREVDRALALQEADLIKFLEAHRVPDSIDP